MTPASAIVQRIVTERIQAQIARSNAQQRKQQETGLYRTSSRSVELVDGSIIPLDSQDISTNGTIRDGDPVAVTRPIGRSGAYVDSLVR